MTENADATVTATLHKAQGSVLATQVACVLGVSAAYYVAAMVGTVLSVPPAGFAIIWPATAILTGAMLVTPRRRWWIYLLGLLPAHFALAAQFQPHAPVEVLLTQIGGNVLVARITVEALKRTIGWPIRFDTFRSVALYVVVGAVAAAVGNALVLGFHQLSGWSEDFWLSWRQWMMACIFPTVTIPPLMVIARERLARGVREQTEQRAAAELLIVCLVLFVQCQIVFSWHVEPAWWPTLLLAALPLLLWAAVRFGVGGACAALLVLGASILMCAIQGRGPFAAGASLASMLSLQVYLILTSVTLLLLAAMVEEWRRTEELLRNADSRMRAAAASTDTGLWQWDETRQVLWMTEHCRTMFGLPQDALVDLNVFLSLVHEEDRPRVAAAAQWMINFGDVPALNEFRIVRPDGQTRWFVARTNTEFGKDKQLLRISGVFRDITPRKEMLLETDALMHRLLTLQEEERENIAMELHDSTTQHLVAAGLSLGMLKRRVAIGDIAQKAVDDIAASLSQATNELRTFTYLLRPASLDRQGLSVVAKRYLEGFAQRSDLVARFTAHPSVDKLPIETQRTLLRIIQEGLMNVHRHTGAMRVSVSIKCMGSRLTLIIADDGNGMLPRPVRKETEGTDLGLGVPGMRVRTQQLGGTIKIRSTPRSTSVLICIPFDAPKTAEI